MSLDVHVSTNGVRSALGKGVITEIARGTLRARSVRHALLSITLLDRPAIARLNRTHLNHAGPTDVISFAFHRATARDPVVGDIYIAPEVARANAHERGVAVREEMARLVVHGTLHVLGFDHPEDEARESSEMWRLQERLVRRFTSRLER